MVSGKAIIYVEKDAGYWRGFLTDVRMISCDHEDRSYIQESIENTIPACATKLKPGERMWVWVRYEIRWSQDYYGEVDCNVEFPKEKVLKRRPPRKPLYISKADRRRLK